MNKFSKIVTVASLISAICLGGAFAKNGKNNRQPNFQNNQIQRPMPNFQKGQPKNCKPETRKPNKMDKLAETVYGKVKSVDATNGKITVTNADNKDVEIAVYSFAKIRNDKKEDVKLSDVKSGSEIIVKVCKSDTTTKVAGKIFIKQ